MANRDEGERRSVEGGAVDDHGEPREYRYGSGFDKPETGRWASQDRENVFSRPYDEWSSPGYAFYAGKGYHREFIDPIGGPAPDGGAGGIGFEAVPDVPRGPHTGRGPRNYVRSDERIGEELHQLLEEHGDLDATDVSVRIVEGEVTLEGDVADRRAKRLAEDIAHSVRGVRDVQNRLRVAERIEHTDADVQGPASHSGTGFLTENIEVPRTRSR